MRCGACRRAVSRALDRGEPPAAEARTHLDLCAGCRAWQEAIAAASRALATSAPAEPPRGLAARAVAAAWEADLAGQRRAGGLMEGVVRIGRVGLAAAGLAALVLGALALAADRPRAAPAPSPELAGEPPDPAAALIAPGALP